MIYRKQIHLLLLWRFAPFSRHGLLNLLSPYLEQIFGILPHTILPFTFRLSHPTLNTCLGHCSHFRCQNFGIATLP